MRARAYAELPLKSKQIERKADKDAATRSERHLSQRKTIAIMRSVQWTLLTDNPDRTESRRVAHDMNSLENRRMDSRGARATDLQPKRSTNNGENPREISAITTSAEVRDRGGWCEKGTQNEQ